MCASAIIHSARGRHESRASTYQMCGDCGALAGFGLNCVGRIRASGRATAHFGYADRDSQRRGRYRSANCSAEWLGLVPARPMATLPELPQQDQQTIVVSPYIELPQGVHSGAQGYGSSTGSQSLPPNYRHRPHSMSPHSGGSYGVPTGTQTQAQIQTQPALPQTPQSSIVTSVLIAAPKSVATPKPAATAPSRSSDPHSATSTVTTSLD